MNIYMYADDTLVMSTGSTENEAIENFQYNLDILTRWCHQNKLTINMSKTKHMCITIKKKTCDIRIKIDTENLANVETFECRTVVSDKN